MVLAIACDHGGFQLKEEIKSYLEEQGHAWEDYGTFSEEAVDYPPLARKAAEAVAQGRQSRGILVCGTGIGMSMVANKVRGIRAALCTDPFMARCSREHNHANVLVLGGRVVGTGLALDIVRAWLETEPGGGRHQRRVEQIQALEDGE